MLFLIALATFSVFLALKLGVGLTTVMAWSWLAVTSPLWIYAIWQGFWFGVLLIFNEL